MSWECNGGHLRDADDVDALTGVCDTCPVVGGCLRTHPRPGFVTKDSGERATYSTGMVRDTEEGKARFSLLFAEGVPYADQFMTRCADLMARGAKKYAARNWEQAGTEEELERYKSSAMRHLVQWLTGDEEEDHAAAVVFNLLAHETTAWKMAHPNPSYFLP